MTEADLGIKSIPRNPLLFGMLHRMEAVEHIGSGIRRIRNLCREYGVAEPQIEVSEHWFTINFPRPVGVVDTDAPHEEADRHQVGTKRALSRYQVEILEKCAEPQPLTALMEIAGRADRTKFRNQVLAPLLEKELVQMTIPDKPRSSKQRYQLTAKGRGILAEQGVSK